ncbi:ABC transporter permease [Aureibaculum marinum]|uniref:ABC transporter permease n=2 Tax=Aureibaculum marinum TaxID=2487930 RepID=A0A3N4NSB2_9FLAO|nr:ABC transporter permease [Aureibaculum marinum]
MLMVDTLLSITNESVKTKFLIKSDCVFVSKNVFSEAGLIENAAQTCSAIVGKSYFKEDDVQGESNKLVGFISGVKNFEINKLPLVNEIIYTNATLVSRFDADGYSICSLKCFIENDNTVLATCEMNLFIKEVFS